jgi:hypothetical protein
MLESTCGVRREMHFPAVLCVQWNEKDREAPMSWDTITPWLIMGGFVLLWLYLLPRLKGGT